jgi:hypothetical protein
MNFVPEQTKASLQQVESTSILEDYFIKLWQIWNLPKFAIEASISKVAFPALPSKKAGIFPCP